MKNLTSYLFIFWIIVVGTSLSQAQTFNLGRFSIGDSRIALDLEDFIIHQSNQNVRAFWQKDSVQWIRNENNLLVPRALLSLYVKDQSGQIYFSFQDKNIIPVIKKNMVTSTIYIDLFNPAPLVIYKGGEVYDRIQIESRPSKNARAKQLIDYSCSPYEISISGIDDEYVSLGCKMHKRGHWGRERPRLEVMMSSTNLRLINGSRAPYTIFLEDDSPVILEMSDQSGAVRTMKLESHLPSTLPRLKTAFGFGPYLYESRKNESTQNGNLAPSIMLYGKLDLTETASLKAFDALLYAKSYFNNSGLYFSYDLATAFDERIWLNALIGFQGLNYRFSPKDKTIFQFIYPQGFEVIYKHAFKENYNLTYGMFLSTGVETYTNAWLRYGKGTFVEFNYINWGHEGQEIKMWGLSMGIPFFSLF